MKMHPRSEGVKISIEMKARVLKRMLFLLFLLFAYSFLLFHSMLLRTITMIRLILRLFLLVSLLKQVTCYNITRIMQGSILENLQHLPVELTLYGTEMMKRTGTLMG